MRSAYYQLINYLNTAKERDVFYYAASTILEHIDQIPELSIGQVADICFASPATISRLVRKLNFESFNEFKQEVIVSIEQTKKGETMHYGKEPIDQYPNVSREEIKNDFKDEIIKNIEFTNSVVRTQDIEEIIDMIDRANRVIFLGFNVGQVLSAQLQTALAGFHKPVVAYSNERLQLEVLEDIHEDDLIILSSITGNYFKYKSAAMEMFKKSPAKKIVITQAHEIGRASRADKVIRIGKTNDSYIGKFSMMMIFEMIEMFYVARHTNETSNINKG